MTENNQTMELMLDAAHQGLPLAQNPQLLVKATTEYTPGRHAVVVVQRTTPGIELDGICFYRGDAGMTGQLLPEHILIVWNGMSIDSLGQDYALGFLEELHRDFHATLGVAEPVLEPAHLQALVQMCRDMEPAPEPVTMVDLEGMDYLTASEHVTEIVEWGWWDYKWHKARFFGMPDGSVAWMYGSGCSCTSFSELPMSSRNVIEPSTMRSKATLVKYLREAAAIAGLEGENVEATADKILAHVRDG